MYEQLVAFMVGFIAIGSSILGLIFYGQKKGEAEEKGKQADELIDSMAEFKEIEDNVHKEVNALDESATDNQLRANGWMQDDNK